MTALRLDDLGQYSDVLLARDGRPVTVRFAGPRDAEELQNYFRSLSARSRYNRFFGAISELPQTLLEHFVHVGERDQFSVIATVTIDGVATIVGEARYAFHAESDIFEFGLSVADGWQRNGLGSALMKNLECRAASFGSVRMFADTLRSNEAMIALARQSGFTLVHHPDDWKLVRFDKAIAHAPQEIPCASWRLAAAQRQAAASSVAV